MTATVYSSRQLILSSAAEVWKLSQYVVTHGGDEVHQRIQNVCDVTDTLAVWFEVSMCWLQTLQSYNFDLQL